MLKRLVYCLFALAILSSLGLWSPSIVKADAISCQASMSAHAVTPSSENVFTVTITNSNPTDIQWVSITRPSSDFFIVSNDSPGWTNTTSTDVAGEIGGDLSSGGNMDVSMDVQSANVDADPASWVAQVSDSPDGSNPVSCSGDLSMAITGPLAPAPPPTIFNLGISSISSSSATLAWQTDVPATSEIDYGLTDAYGSSKSDNSLQTDHSMVLKDLQPDTTYHYQVVATGSNGSPNSSGDSTFLTALEQAQITNTTTIPGLAVQVTNPADKTPPTIAITSSLPKIVKTIPKISGTASDDVAVVRIEYSTDGGLNWLPADVSSGLGTKAVNFSFTPLNLDDGNYSILARAIDGGGNITATAPINIVIDQLPPLVGGNIVSIGPQVLEPNTNGVITTQTGVDEKITISAVGGPTSINLIAQNPKDPKNTKSFSLTQSIDSGLWSGILSFGKPGTYNLVANAVDGAANKTSKTINSVSVSAPSQTLKQGTKQPVVANVTAYYLQPDSDSWVVWDGAAYAQTNPQTTGKDGTFSLFLPAGKYYLKASAKGYHSLSSTIFKLSQPTPVLTMLNMKPGRDLKLGPVDLSAWDFLSKNVKLNLGDAKNSEGNSQNSLVGRPLPNFNLTDTNGHAIHAADLLGKPTLVSLLSTWAPTVSEQLGSLSQLQKNPDTNIEPVALQQDTGQAVAYDQIAGYNLTWLTDPNSTLTNLFNATSLPTNYFIDRQGIVRQVISGVLTKQEILNNLSNL